MLGTTLQKRYRIDALLGRGGMATVYRGYDVRLARPVAVKCMDNAVSASDGLERMMHEARAAAALNHRHIVAVHDTGVDAGVPFIVMELIEGPNLRDAGTLTFEQIIAIAGQVCEALEHVHALSIVHRDLKPENVLLAPGPDGPIAKLADLGVALAAGSLRLTESGGLVGTAAYLAPEQALGGPVDGRADLYSLGAMLYELTTGRLPFAGDAALAIVSQHINAPLVPPRTWREDLPPELEAIIVRCLAKRPDDRFQSAREVGAALARVPLGGPPPDAAPASSDRLVLLDRLSRGRLIGRRRELADLQALWTRALRGESHMALLSGEPGVGKTRLAHELTVAAQLSGAIVLRGGCYEFEATTPYLPFVEALQQWVSSVEGETLRARLGEGAGELARLTPEIALRLGTAPASGTLAPHESRLRLFDAVGHLLHDLAEERGVLLVLDDLHWADPSTLALLHHVLRRLRNDRLLVLGCYREIELDRQHPLASALVEWNRERLATRIALGRLTRDDTAVMLGAMFGQERSTDDFAEVVHRETEGNPFFVEEVVKSLIEGGQIYRGGGEWQRKSIDELAIPQSIRAAIGHRLSRLSEPCLDALHVAAALGKVFSYDELRVASDAGEDALLDALDEATNAQLVRPLEREAFAFTHDKIREVLHDELNPVRRRRLHQRIGERLETLWGPKADEHAADLSYHFARGTDLERGLRYARAAAERSTAVFAFEEAVEAYDAAIECAESLGRPADIASLHEQAADALYAGGFQVAGAERAERALSGEPRAEQRARLKGKVGEMLAQASDPRARTYLEDALRELDPASQRDERAAALTMLGRVHHYSGELAAALDTYQQAFALLEHDPPSSARGRTLVMTAGTYQHVMLLDESNNFARRAIEEGKAAGEAELVASGHEFLAENCSIQGRWRIALENASQDLVIGQRTGSHARSAWAYFPLTVVCFSLGETRQALEHADACIALCQRIGERRLESLLLSWASLFTLEAGHARRAQDMLDRAAALADEVTHAHIKAEVSRARGLMHSMCGAWGEAMAAFERCPGLLASAEAKVNPLFTSLDAAETLLELGERERAAVLLDTGEAIAHAGNCPHQLARVKALRGWVAWLAGQRAGAITMWDEAERAFTELESRYLLGRVLAMRAILHHRAGEAAESQTFAARAREVFTSSGVVHSLQRMEAALA